MGDSIRATASELAHVLSRPRVLTWGAAILTAVAFLWMRAVDVSLWMASLAKAADVAALEERVATIERERTEEKQKAYAEQVATVTTLRNMAGDAAARTRPKDANAAANARARFDEFMLRTRDPVTSLDLVLRELKR